MALKPFCVAFDPKGRTWSKRDQKLPPYLYHVQHADSQATTYYLDSDCDSESDASSSPEFPTIEASAPPLKTYFYRDLAARAVIHQKWSSKVPSCFISAFDDFDHARNWAAQRLQRGRGPVHLYTIDTQKIQGKHIWVFCDPNEDEYFFLHRIPRDVIVDSQEVKLGKPPHRKCTYTHLGLANRTP
ncbi:hypothetical protein B0T20DRAFT_114409 [Sordaria brevicollis]|uniref:DUF7587 domain-containing protein n=1 Tax=Sordaria brevicollis TaxID=83679 RepID=A0AAE0PK77_SORBR|nr:hypothetical protein B0T20DRAFT_114409 [Sordaria brevicollis]